MRARLLELTHQISTTNKRFFLSSWCHFVKNSYPQTNNNSLRLSMRLAFIDSSRYDLATRNSHPEHSSVFH